MSVAATVALTQDEPFISGCLANLFNEGQDGLTGSCGSYGLATVGKAAVTGRFGRLLHQKPEKSLPEDGCAMAQSNE
jgi:hypothetical protein